MISVYQIIFTTEFISGTTDTFKNQNFCKSQTNLPADLKEKTSLKLLQIRSAEPKAIYYCQSLSIFGHLAHYILFTTGSVIKRKAAEDFPALSFMKWSPNGQLVTKTWLFQKRAGESDPTLTHISPPLLKESQFLNSYSSHLINRSIFLKESRGTKGNW